MEIIAVRGLTFAYPEQEKPVLREVDFAAEAGEFIVLVGPSGCGKSTLLRHLKTVLTPHGVRRGEIWFRGEVLDQVDSAVQAASIGFVQQSPEHQVVTDKVWHELAFGLESLGYSNQAIRSRVAEMASFFGIQNWFYQNVSELSGGQKQLLNLAAIMTMQPDLLILDEPTSQLDPIAAADFLGIVGKINRELGTTVIITEHRLEEVFPFAGRVLVMDSGTIISDAAPRDTGKYLKSAGHGMFLSMPVPMRIWAAVENELDCPVTVRDGRQWLDQLAAKSGGLSGSDDLAAKSGDLRGSVDPAAGAGDLSDPDNPVAKAGSLRGSGNPAAKSGGLSGFDDLAAKSGDVSDPGELTRSGCADKVCDEDQTAGRVCSLARSGCAENVTHGADLSGAAGAGMAAGVPAQAGTVPVPARPAVELDHVWFRYEKDGQDVVKDLSFKAYRGEFLAVLGGNGTGKTTALSMVSGLNKPWRGTVHTDGGRLAALPQDPQALFVKKTVGEDLLEIVKETRMSREEKKRLAYAAAHLCKVDHLLERHPYDLSGGEQQCAALAKVLLLKPEILLLDEPTKGLDAECKRSFGAILQSLAGQGVCIVMVSHDVEFCASYAHRCALFFDGAVVTEGVPRDFFSGNSFYTTAANRMSRHLLTDAVTAEDVIRACGGTVPAWPEEPTDGRNPEILAQAFSASDQLLLKMGEENSDPAGKPVSGANKNAGLPLWRKILAGISGAAALGAFIYAMRGIDLTAVLRGTGGVPDLGGDYLWIYGILLMSLFLLALSITRRSPEKKEAGPVLSAGDEAEEAEANRAAASAKQTAGSASGVSQRDGLHGAGRATSGTGRRKLRRRTLAAALMILVAVPITIFVGIWFLEDRKYYFISMMVILETLLPFVLVFESRRPQARELVLIAVLCALGVAGRAAFIALPGFKPVLAIVIISGVALGGETGFLVGAVIMFVSNMMFGQGPWTPWQMFGMGIIGFLAGVLFQKGLIRRDRLSLCIFGAIMTVVVYGGLMNPASVLMYQPHPTLGMLLVAYVTGFPADVLHAAATVLFLWLLSQPLLEKLDRVKVKYGLIE